MDAEKQAAEAALLAYLDDLGITYTRHGHPPLFTVEDSRQMRGAIPGAHTKNLFMLDRQKAPWLATCREDRKIRIKDLERAVGAKGLSFGKPEALLEVLGVTPGAVTAFGLFNDRDTHRVRFLLDRQMIEEEPINMHPLHNEATLAVSRDGLMTFLAATGHEPVLVDFDALEELAEAHQAAKSGRE